MDKERSEKKEFSIHKECAVVGVDVARRPKYQLIASVLYYVNFWLRRVDRKTDLFDDLSRQYKAEKDPECIELAEKIYDQVLDIMYSSIEDNYGHDELNLALEMLTRKTELEVETEFERNVRSKQVLEKQMQDALIDKVETEARKERTKMSIEQLLATVAEQAPKEEFAKTGQPQDTGFLSKMHTSQAYMGPYSLIMAEKFIKIEEAARANQRDERISFVKMEYFLYAVTEAHRCVVDLRQMEARNNQLQDELEFLQADVASMGTVIPGYFKNKDQAADYSRRVTMAETASRTLEQLRS